MNSTYLKRRKYFTSHSGTIIKVIFAITLSCLFSSCKKQTEYPGTASLCIVNAVPDSRTMIPNFAESGPLKYSLVTPQTQISFLFFQSASSLYSSYSGQQRIRFYFYPDTTDKDVVADLRLDLPVGSINSLFLTGTSSAVDTMFFKDELPSYAIGDSVMGIRFVNLSAGSRPISVNIKGQPNASEVSSLDYKNITAFKRYPMTAATSEYIFEFRDAETGDLITSYDASDMHGDKLGTWIYRPLTLVFQGIPGGTDILAQNVVRVHYFSN